MSPGDVDVAVGWGSGTVDAQPKPMMAAAMTASANVKYFILPSFVLKKITNELASALFFCHMAKALIYRQTALMAAAVSDISKPPDCAPQKWGKKCGSRHFSKQKKENLCPPDKAPPQWI